jgi:hypothetical protein
LYRDGAGLPLYFNIGTNSAGEIEAAHLSYQKDLTITNALFVLHLSESGLIATGHLETPSNGCVVPVILKRNFAHQMATERRSFLLRDYSASDEYVGEFPVWGSSTPFLRALTTRVTEECQAEAGAFIRGRLDHWREIVRYSLVTGRDGYELEHWQTRVLTERIASFAVWGVPERGQCGNSTSWKGRNYWWTGSKLREIQLQDLFVAGSDWATVIRQYCWHDLVRQEVLSPEGVRSGDVGINIFTLSPTGLQIYFNPYQVSSGGDGEFVVHVPYTLVEHLLRPNGPASALRSAKFVAQVRK